MLSIKDIINWSLFQVRWFCIQQLILNMFIKIIKWQITSAIQYTHEECKIKGLKQYLKKLKKN